MNKISFSSLLVYSPNGKSDMDIKSRDQMCYPIKDCHEKTITKVVSALHDSRDKFPGRFGNDVLLVPIPSHNSLHRRWSANEVGRSIVQFGMAHQCLPLLKRVATIEASKSFRGKRTVERHLQSLQFEEYADHPKIITLIDDVVTSGASLLAAYQLAEQAFPNTEIHAFALIRTVETVGGRLSQPYDGTIMLKSNGMAHRT